jgi:hypothetical protein
VRSSQLKGLTKSKAPHVEFAACWVGNTFSTPSKPDMCGKILIVNVTPSTLHTLHMPFFLSSIDCWVTRLIHFPDPYFYIPATALTNGVLKTLDTPEEKKNYSLASLSAGGKSTERVLAFGDSTGDLANLIRIEVSALGLSCPIAPPYFLFLIRCRCMVRRRRKAPWLPP